MSNKGMTVRVFSDKAALGRAAAATAAEILREAIESAGVARFVAATGMSQFEFLAELVKAPGIDWSKTEMFHLDEYVGLPIDHPASFRAYLLERLIRPAGIARAHLLDGEGDPEAVCEAAGRAINAGPIDVAFVGIGQNGHLAFNDPPADFETETPFMVVKMDEVCRRQQVDEGWFRSMAEVPELAITMSIRQILKARKILCIVRGARKAEVIRDCLEGEIGPMAPASALRLHPDVEIFMNREVAELLKTTPLIDEDRNADVARNPN